jgi:CheY-like chemotaxis protein
MILIIEDDQNWIGIYQRILKKYKIRFCHDGFSAIRQIEKQHPKLIILDLSLIGPNGLAILNELQSYPDLISIPVIICSNTAINIQDLSVYQNVVASYDKAKITPEELQREVLKYVQ